MNIDLTDEGGAAVISIEVLRARRVKREKDCHHQRTQVDEELATLKCLDCDAILAPIPWIIGLAEHWHEVIALRESARAERARLDLKQRVRCTHCGEFVKLYGSSEDEKRRRALRETRLADALSRISLLNPDVAAKSAPRIAREALAACPKEETCPVSTP